jgi:hypothetical protein
MSDESFEFLERRLAATGVQGAPGGLRGAVLGDVQRELRAARWDRRLARAAVLLLVVGVGLNVAISWRQDGAAGGSQQRIAKVNTRQSLVDTAVVVAEVTDAATGRRFARQLAEMTGGELTKGEAAAIDAAIERPMSHAAKGRRG